MNTSSALLFSLGLLLSTGCAKDELTAPSAPVKVHKTTANGGSGSTGDPGTVDPGNSSGGTINPITDDGDDQGDREHSSNSSKPLY